MFVGYGKGKSNFTIEIEKTVAARLEKPAKDVSAKEMIKEDYTNTWKRVLDEEFAKFTSDK